MVQKKKGSDPDGRRKTATGAETEEPEVELAESAFVGRTDSEIVEHTEVTMEEGEEPTGRGEKRGREEEEGEGQGDGEEDGQPSAKRLKSDSKERDPESSESRQEEVEQRPSHAVTSRKESCAESMSIRTSFSVHDVIYKSTYFYVMCCADL